MILHLDVERRMIFTYLASAEQWSHRNLNNEVYTIKRKYLFAEESSVLDLEVNVK